MNKTVIEIIKKNLIEEGFDGLYNEDLECGCEIADLEPCGEIRSDCTAGYKHPGNEGNDFYIKDHKPEIRRNKKEITMHHDPKLLAKTIKSVAVVPSTGAEVYRLGKVIDGREVHRISIADIYIEGEPYMHYCGFDVNDELIFTINPHTPCVVEYSNNQL